MTNDELTDLLKLYPFLTHVRHADAEYIGIVQNQDANFISIYVLEDIKTDNLRALFLEYGEQWWWETNRMIPIDIIMGDKFEVFASCMKTFNTKDFEILFGPTVSLRNLIQKRIKRKNIQLVRKLK